MSKATFGLPVVPVKVTGIGCEKPVITYAFLGNVFNSTFLYRGPTKRVRAEG